MKPTELDTTERIKQWSMRGANRDVAGRFRSTDDIRGLLGARPGQGANLPELGEQPVATVIPLFVKRPDEQEWRPLAPGRRDARERG